MVAHKVICIYIYEGPKWHSDFVVLICDILKGIIDQRSLENYSPDLLNFFLLEVSLLFKIKNKKIGKLETGHVFTQSPNFLRYSKKCGNQAAQFLRKYLGPGQFGSVVKASAYGLKGYRLYSQSIAQTSVADSQQQTH